MHLIRHYDNIQPHAALYVNITNTTYSNMEISELYDIFRTHPIVTTDTRQCVKDSIFFALKGASFNGNDFALKALHEGCSYAVVD